MYEGHTHTRSHTNTLVVFLFPATLSSADVMCVARALRQLSQSPHSSLAALSIGVLPCPELLEVLLAASPNLASVHVEVQTVWGFQGFPPPHGWPTDAGAVELGSE